MWYALYKTFDYYYTYMTVFVNLYILFFDNIGIFSQSEKFNFLTETFRKNIGKDDVYVCRSRIYWRNTLFENL